MSEDYSEYSADGEDNHPALKKFSRPLAMIKHVAMKALKWAAIGAIAGAIAFAILPTSITGTIAGIGSTVVGWFSNAGATKVAEWGFSRIASAALSGITFGAIAGSALGGLSGLIGAGSAADEQAERMVANAEGRESREMNRQMLAMQREQQLMALRQQQLDLGLSPGVMPGRQRGGMEMGS